MNKLLLTVAFLSTSMLGLHADWTTNYKAALAQAKTQNKHVLLDFTGSDWCPNCQLLDKEVLSQPSFKVFADKNYLLVTVDFPEQKQLPDDVKAQNDQLQKQFHVDGFPTLVVVNANGKELGRQLGYDIGSGPDAVISKLKSFTK
jgi:thiol:disulfide interchange protein